jgi:hypothetical protein
MRWYVSVSIMHMFSLKIELRIRQLTKMENKVLKTAANTEVIAILLF